MSSAPIIVSQKMFVDFLTHSSKIENLVKYKFKNICICSFDAFSLVSEFLMKGKHLCTLKTIIVLKLKSLFTRHNKLEMFIFLKENFFC